MKPELLIRDYPTANVISRSFLTAYLLIGDTAGAERALLRAIDLWNPYEESEEQLFQITLETATKITMSRIDSKNGEKTDCLLPPELHAVLELPHQVRRSFVLRVLAGVPLEACSEMLHLDIPQVTEYCLAALEKLSAIHPSIGGQMPEYSQ